MARRGARAAGRLLLGDRGRHRALTGPAAGDQGSAAVEFVLVGALVTVLVVAVLQLALALHVRTTLVDAAAEGARYAAAGRTAAEGAERTRALVSAALSPAYADDVAVGRTTLDGLDVVEVTVRAPLPVVGLLGPSATVEVAAHALAEGP